MISLQGQKTGRRAGNRLSHWMLKRGVSVADLVLKCTDANATAINLMEQDKVLPTKTDLPIIARVLDVTPTDIWPRDKLDLLGLSKDEATNDKKGQKRCCFWLSESEFESIERAIKGMGYDSKISWFREMADKTVQAAQMKGVY